MASRMAAAVISWKTMRRTGIWGLRTSSRCQAMASPSRSSSVARYSSSALRSSDFSRRTWSLAVTTYSGLKPSSGLTPSVAHCSDLKAAGTSDALRGRSRMWPTEDSTT